MKAKAKVSFYDIKADVDRKVGDEFEVTETRFNELNNTEYGELVVKVAEKKPSARKAPAKEVAK